MAGEQKKSLEDILKELKDVLDNMSSKTPEQREAGIEEIESKVEPSENKDVTFSMKNEVINKKEKEIKDDYVEKSKSAETLSQKEQSSSVVEIKQHTIDNSSDNVSVSLESQSVEEKKENVVETSQKQSDEIVVNSIFVCPKSVSETKTTFYENLNSTIKRVGKKKIMIVPCLEILYSDVKEDLLKKYQSIVDDLRKNNIKCIFVVTNEMVEVEDFISKISSETSVVKQIKYSELKLKSIYLDLAIEILLVVK